MIVLGKDKVDERFNILEDGTIVDLNGNVQELKIHQGRLYFKGQLVHKIMMYTFYGYRDGHKWVIHHLDENKQNNVLTNLVYITRSEHSRLHMKGTYLSEKTKRRMCESHKGKHLSKEHKLKLSLAAKNRIWVNNGLSQKLVFKDNIQEGFIKGRLF